MKVVATLLSHGCSTLIPDANGWIPVCYALWRENTACVLLLLKVNDDNSLRQLRVRNRRKGKGREGKGREGKGREEKGREEKGREEKGREGNHHI